MYRLAGTESLSELIPASMDTDYGAPAGFLYLRGRQGNRGPDEMPCYHLSFREGKSPAQCVMKQGCLQSVGYAQARGLDERSWIVLLDGPLCQCGALILVLRL